MGEVGVLPTASLVRLSLSRNKPVGSILFIMLTFSTDSLIIETFILLTSILFIRMVNDPDLRPFLR